MKNKTTKYRNLCGGKRTRDCLKMNNFFLTFLHNIITCSKIYECNNMVIKERVLI